MKSYYEWPIGTHQLSFERCHPRPLRRPLPQDWGSQPQPKTAIAIIPGTAKLRTANLADTFTGYIRTKAHEKFGRTGSVGVSMDYPNFFEYPLLSREWVELRTSNFVCTFIGSIWTKAIKSFGISSRERTQGLSKILRAPIYRGIARLSLR